MYHWRRQPASIAAEKEGTAEDSTRPRRFLYAHSDYIGQEVTNDF